MLEKEANEKAQIVISLINKLPEIQDLKITDEASVKEIRSEYEKLDDLKKAAYVSKQYERNIKAMM